MRLHSRFVLALFSLFFGSAAFAQGEHTDFPNYGLGSLAISSTAGTNGGAAGAFWNPAVWAAMRGWEASFAWNDRNLVEHRMDDWGLFLGGYGLGFGMKRAAIFSPGVPAQTSFIEDYQVALGGGDPGWYWGMAYGWSKGRTNWLHRDHYVSWGTLYRPLRYLSLGSSASYGLDDGDYRGIVDMGVRPLGSHRVTAFGDAAFGRRDNLSTMQWGAGAEILPLNGLRIALKVTKPYAHVQDKIVSLGIGLAIDNTGFDLVPHYNDDSDRLSTSYLVRVSDLVPDFSTRTLFDRGRKVVTVPMKGSLTYQKARWFDREKIKFYEMLTAIDNAKRDEAVGGIALNMSGLVGSRELLWELREKLSEFKASGKKIYIYIDNVGMAGYYFASVADYLWIDPEGSITTQGYVAGRTFMKGFLEKIGLGVEEWRFFTYKSAFEALSRKDMSEADKEQRLALIQDFFDEWQHTIAESRDLTPEKIRGGVDTMGIFTAKEALAFGLVDSIGTWDDTPDFVEHVMGKRPDLINRHEVQAYDFADPEWGRPPEIAIVYAVGESDMDTGFRARYTSRVLRSLGKKKNVKAIILRADSPGGDALAADLIARQMKETASKKPVIVTQGDVAASGGYWISMYGDPIYASPFTITGSIGVIGGWIWNESFSNKTGFTSDHVQIGEHADLGFGVTLPLLGAQIPDRNLDDVEHARMEKIIRGLYADFTDKVADGRDLEQTYVDSIGQGRVWSGKRAKDLKLVDEIGGLEQAIADARRRTNLTNRRHVKIAEYPRAGLFGLDELMAPTSPIAILSRLFNRVKPELSSAWKENYEWRVFQRMASSPGKPLLMIPPEDIPAE